MNFSPIFSSTKQLKIREGIVSTFCENLDDAYVFLSLLPNGVSHAIESQASHHAQPLESRFVFPFLRKFFSLRCLRFDEFLPSLRRALDIPIQISELIGSAEILYTAPSCVAQKIDWTNEIRCVRVSEKEIQLRRRYFVHLEQNLREENTDELVFLSHFADNNGSSILEIP